MCLSLAQLLYSVELIINVMLDEARCTQPVIELLISVILNILLWLTNLLLCIITAFTFLSYDIAQLHIMYIHNILSMGIVHLLIIEQVY